MASSNTSKTAHVMNLLSKNRGEAAKEQPAEPSAEVQAGAQPAAPQAEPAPAAAVAPILSSLTADAAVSSQIKDALEAELEEAPKAVQPPVQQAAPVQETVQEPVRQSAPAEAAPMDLPAAHEDASYVNVMQILVEEKADEYMKMFGICRCEKCRVDVRAYALNHLPPKYVVMSEHERVPRLTVYESRFASDITAQLIQACKQVMLTPHHTRADN